MTRKYVITNVERKSSVQRENARKRWNRLTPEQRSAATEPGRAAVAAAREQQVQAA
jgi:hypothetical protein